MTGHLHHPFLRWMLSDSGDCDAARLQVQEEKDVISCQPAPSEHLDGEEVDTSQNGHVSANEVCPVHLLPALRSRSYTKAPSVTRLPIWPIHKPLAVDAIPAISTFRVDRSIKNRTRKH